MSEETLFIITQGIFILCFVTIIIVDIKSIANGISKLRNKIYRIKYKKQIECKEQNIKNLYSYIFYTILPKLTKDQFIKICSHNFKYNDSYYELYLEKQESFKDFRYRITLRKIISIRRYMSPLRNLLVDTDKKLIFLFNFTRNGPENVHISLKDAYENNIGIILVALMLIYGHYGNTINNCPEFKGDKNIYEQLD
jgi:hypothetical protein|nr:MAG TPA: hypothetical protein [Caudoviricetes sp.]